MLNILEFIEREKNELVIPYYTFYSSLITSLLSFHHVRRESFFCLYISILPFVLFQIKLGFSLKIYFVSGMYR